MLKHTNAKNGTTIPRKLKKVGKMEIRNFRPVNHATIKANFNVYIEKWDLYLNKMVLLQTSKGKFVSSPSDRYEKDGETKYFPYYAFGKDSNKKFLIRKAFR